MLVNLKVVRAVDVIFPEVMACGKYGGESPMPKPPVQIAAIVFVGGFLDEGANMVVLFLSLLSLAGHT
jgi:hypothetical protein